MSVLTPRDIPTGNNQKTIEIEEFINSEIFTGEAKASLANGGRVTVTTFEVSRRGIALSEVRQALCDAGWCCTDITAEERGGNTLYAFVFCSPY